MPLPDSVDAEALQGADGWAVLEAFGREVFLEMGGDERIDYEELLEDFREDPQGMVLPALTPAVASGITISSALAYVLPVTAWLLKLAAERVANQAMDTLGSATREKLARLLGGRGHRSAIDEAGTDSVPASSLEPDEEQAALAALAAWAESIGADAAQAREVAEAIIRALRDDEGRGR